jgi:hypothetical protein
VTGSFSVTAGVNGTVTTLAYYSGGNAHPGVNSVDIGAPGGTSVWHQLDYLPADIAGGWIRAYSSKDAGYCSQWYPGSPYYNGDKLIVVTYFYGTDGAYRGWHRSAYQHVVPGISNGWWRWNNATTTQVAWGSPDLVYGSGASNGLYLGSVYGVNAPVYNGPGGGLCTDGSHLHQEGDGARGGGLFVGKALTNRYHDVHLFGIAGGLPATGAVPSDPTFDPPVIVNPPVGDPPAGDPPAGDPPTGDPPTGDPPAGDPPTGALIEGHTTDRGAINASPDRSTTSTGKANDPTTLSAPVTESVAEASEVGCSAAPTRNGTRGGDAGVVFPAAVGVALLLLRRRRSPARIRRV